MATEMEHTGTALVDSKELDAAEQAAQDSAHSYTHVFEPPFEFEGESFGSLSFDWERLTGGDSLAIEREVLAVTGRPVITPEFSGEYLVRMAVRACTVFRQDGKRKLGADAYRTMRLSDFNAIRNAARSFLLSRA